MLAILHHRELYNHPVLMENSELAADHFHSHFVISSDLTGTAQIEEYLKKQKILYQILPVEHSFHSAFIDAASSEYLNFMQSQILQKPKKPFISCALASRLNEISPDHFWNCVRKPIQFQSTIDMMEMHNSYFYIDVGTSGSLATFVKYLLRNNSFSKAFPVLTPFGEDLKNIERLYQAISFEHLL